MSVVPYHQAKKLIETGIKEYVEQFGGAELPRVEIERINLSVSYLLARILN